MNAEKIQQLINDENSNREHETSQEARRIIARISDAHRSIADNNKRIEELRAELKALSHEPLNPTQILG